MELHLAPVHALLLTPTTPVVRLLVVRHLLTLLVSENGEETVGHMVGEVLALTTGTIPPTAADAMVDIRDRLHLHPERLAACAVTGTVVDPAGEVSHRLLAQVEVGRDHTVAAGVGL